MPAYKTCSSVLILGSAPDALRVSGWPKLPFDGIVAINNAWRIHPAWTYSIFPSDFPPDKRAAPGFGQYLCSASDYVKVQNRFGGFVYAGGTMAFTAAYWALGQLQPKCMFFLGCDMVYSAGQQTHFYGQGEPDPLRADITLMSLEAKSARFAALAEREGCRVFNLSELPESRLIFPRLSMSAIKNSAELSGMIFHPLAVDKALQREKKLNYFVENGEYWKYFDRFDADEIRALDNLWLDTLVVEDK